MATREKQKEYMKDWDLKRRASRRELINNAKNIPCADCGIKYPPYIMDFDHRDPDQKSFGIGESLVSKRPEVLLAEIAKCDVVCSNCHRERTHSKNYSPVV